MFEFNDDIVSFIQLLIEILFRKIHSQSIVSTVAIILDAASSEFAFQLQASAHFHRNITSRVFQLLTAFISVTGTFRPKDSDQMQ
jgi:hypothetical protein